MEQSSQTSCGKSEHAHDQEIKTALRKLFPGRTLVIEIFKERKFKRLALIIERELDRLKEAERLFLMLLHPHVVSDETLKHQSLLQETKEQITFTNALLEKIRRR